MEYEHRAGIPNGPEPSGWIWRAGAPTERLGNFLWG